MKAFKLNKKESPMKHLILLATLLISSISCVSSKLAEYHELAYHQSKIIENFVAGDRETALSLIEEIPTEATRLISQASDWQGDCNVTTLCDDLAALCKGCDTDTDCYECLQVEVKKYNKDNNTKAESLIECEE